MSTAYTKHALVDIQPLINAAAWGINHGNSVIPKSKTPARIKANFEGDFKLKPEDLKKLDALDKKIRFNDASAGFGYNYFADLDGKD